MLDRGDDVDPQAIESLAAQLRGDASLPLVLRGSGCGKGNATGRLTGGSLTLVAASLGTSWEIDTRGGILMLEDVGELPYRIDRMLQQLVGSGKFEKLAGVGIGAFTDCADDRYPEIGIRDLILDIVRPLGVPVVFELPFGHVRTNWAWPRGGRATIDAVRGVIRIEEQGVNRAA
jgi:muramoyltetrapeptide carboxypeptidase